MDAPTLWHWIAVPLSIALIGGLALLGVARWLSWQPARIEAILLILALGMSAGTLGHSLYLSKKADFDREVDRLEAIRIADDVSIRATCIAGSNQIQSLRLQSTGNPRFCRVTIHSAVGTSKGNPVAAGEDLEPIPSVDVTCNGNTSLRAVLRERTNLNQWIRDFSVDSIVEFSGTISIGLQSGSERQEPLNVTANNSGGILRCADGFLEAER
jgi:hypothetical protein